MRAAIITTEARATDIVTAEVCGQRFRYRSVPMATKKKKRSSLKRIRQTTRRTSIKTLARSAARTAVKDARKAIEQGGEAVHEAIADAASILDRAAKRGAIHKNAARRGRSRIAKRAAKKTA
jgi:small subunit ribosomal protein S20